MLKYNPQLKTRARTLRTHLTDAEQRLWSRLRGKQILAIQFYRQKPIGNYIVDFYAPTARLVIEVDGAHHLDVAQARYDRQRSEHLEERGLRYYASTIGKSCWNWSLSQKLFIALWMRVYVIMNQKLKIPPNLPLQKGGIGTLAVARSPVSTHCIFVPL